MGFIVYSTHTHTQEAGQTKCIEIGKDWSKINCDGRVSCGELANKFQKLNCETLFSGVVGASPRQQFFRTTPGDSFVPEGGRAILTCVIGDLGGRVQWTKDGLTLGMC